MVLGYGREARKRERRSVFLGFLAYIPAGERPAATTRPTSCCWVGSRLCGEEKIFGSCVASVFWPEATAFLCRRWSYDGGGRGARRFIGFFPVVL